MHRVYNLVTVCCHTISSAARMVQESSQLWRAPSDTMHPWPHKISCHVDKVKKTPYLWTKTMETKYNNHTMPNDTTIQISWCNKQIKLEKSKWQIKVHNCKLIPYSETLQTWHFFFWGSWSFEHHFSKIASDKWPCSWGLKLRTEKCEHLEMPPTPQVQAMRNHLLGTQKTGSHCCIWMFIATLGEITQQHRFWG